jgi:Kef-type K+ transport system membrane component KefB
VLVGLFFSAWVCQWMQVNFIFGAFLYGAIMPRSEGIIRHVRQGLESAVHLMLPMFFVITGLTVNLTTLRPDDLGILAAVLAVAIFGKVGGGYAGARLTGIPRRGSAVMAALVNTRGLTELVILSVGLQEHLLSPQLYALMIVMALVTTAMTGPLLNWIQPMVISAPDAETTRTSMVAFGAGGLSANMASARPAVHTEDT